MVEQHSEKRRHGRLAQSFERSDRRRHLHARDDGLLQAAYGLARRTKQRPTDRVGVLTEVRAQNSAVGFRAKRWTCESFRSWSAMRPRMASKDAGARFFKSDAVGQVSAVTTVSRFLTITSTRAISKNRKRTCRHAAFQGIIPSMEQEIAWRCISEAANFHRIFT